MAATMYALSCTFVMCIAYDMVFNVLCWIVVALLVPALQLFPTLFLHVYQRKLLTSHFFQ